MKDLSYTERKMKEIEIKMEWLEPFHKGFRRAVQQRVYPYQKKYFVNYIAPTGEDLRRPEQVTKYLNRHPHLDLTVDNFYFHGRIIYKEPEETYTEVVVQYAKDDEIPHIQSPSPKGKKVKTPDKCGSAKKVLNEASKKDGQKTVSSKVKGKDCKNETTEQCSPGKKVTIKSPGASVQSKSPSSGVKTKSPNSGIKKKISSIVVKSSKSPTGEVIYKNASSMASPELTIIKKPRGRPKKLSIEATKSPCATGCNPTPSKNASTPAATVPSVSKVKVEQRGDGDSSDDEVQLNLSKTKLSQTNMKPLKRKLKRPTLNVAKDRDLPVSSETSVVVRKRGRPKKIREPDEGIAVKSEIDAGEEMGDSEGRRDESKTSSVEDKLCDRQTAKVKLGRKRVKHCQNKEVRTCKKSVSPGMADVMDKLPQSVCENNIDSGSPLKKCAMKQAFYKTTKKKVLGSKISSLAYAKKKFRTKEERKQVTEKPKKKRKIKNVNLLPEEQENSDLNTKTNVENTVLTCQSYFNPCQTSKNLVTLTPPVDLGTSFSDTMAPIPSEIDYQCIEECAGSVVGDTSMSRKDCSMDIKFLTPDGPRVVTKFAEQNLSPSAGISCEEVETRYTSSEGAPSVFSPTCVTPHEKCNSPLEFVSLGNNAAIASEDKPQKMHSNQYISKVVLHKKVVNVPPKVRGIKATVKLLERRCDIDLTPSVSLIKFDNALFHSLSLRAFCDSGDSNSSAATTKVIPDVGEKHQQVGVELTDFEPVKLGFTSLEHEDEDNTVEKRKSGFTAPGLFEKYFKIQENFLAHNEDNSPESVSKIGKVGGMLSTLPETGSVKRNTETVEVYQVRQEQNHRDEESFDNNSQAVSTTAVHGEIVGHQPLKNVDVHKKVQRARKKQTSVDVDLNEENFEPDYEDSNACNSDGSEEVNNDDEVEEEGDSSNDEHQPETMGQDVLQHHILDKDYLMDKFLEGPLLSFQLLGSPNTLEREVMGKPEDRYNENVIVSDLNVVKEQVVETIAHAGKITGVVFDKDANETTKNQLTLETPADQRVLLEGYKQVLDEAKLQGVGSEAKVVLKDYTKEMEQLVSKTTAAKVVERTPGKTEQSVSKSTAASEVERTLSKQGSDLGDDVGLSSNLRDSNQTGEASCTKNPSVESSDLTHETVTVSSPVGKGNVSRGTKKVKKTRIKVQKSAIDEDGYIVRNTASGKKRFKVNVVNKKATATAVAETSDPEKEMEGLEDIIGRAIATSEHKELTLAQGTSPIKNTPTESANVMPSVESLGAECSGLAETSSSTQLTESPIKGVKDGSSGLPETSSVGDKTTGHTASFEVSTAGHSAVNQDGPDNVESTKSLMGEKVDGKLALTEKKTDGDNLNTQPTGKDITDTEAQCGQVEESEMKEPENPDEEQLKSVASEKNVSGVKEQDKEGDVPEECLRTSNLVIDESVVEDNKADSKLNDKEETTVNKREDIFVDIHGTRRVQPKADEPCAANVIEGKEESNEKVCMEKLKECPTGKESVICDETKRAQKNTSAKTSDKEDGTKKTIDKEDENSKKQSAEADTSVHHHSSAKVEGKRRGSSHSSSKKSGTISVKKCGKGEVEKTAKVTSLKSEDSGKDKKVKKHHKEGQKEHVESRSKKTHIKEKQRKRIHDQDKKESETMKVVKLATDHKKTKIVDHQDVKVHKERKPKHVPMEQTNDSVGVDSTEKHFKPGKLVIHLKESARFFEAMEKEKAEPKKRPIQRRASKEEKNGNGKTEENTSKCQVIGSRRSSGEKSDQRHHTTEDNTKGEGKETVKEKSKLTIRGKEQSIADKGSERKRVAAGKEEKTDVQQEGNDAPKKRKLKVKGRQVNESETSFDVKSETEVKKTTTPVETSVSVTVPNVSASTSCKVVRVGLLHCCEHVKAVGLRPVVSPPKRTAVKMGSLYCVPSSDEETTADTSFAGDESLGEGTSGGIIDFSALKGLKITTGTARSVEVNKTKGSAVTRTVLLKDFKVDDKTDALVTKILQEVKIDVKKYQEKPSNSIKLNHILLASAMSSAVAVKKPPPLAPPRTESLVRDERDEVRSPKVATVQPVKDISNTGLAGTCSSQRSHPIYQTKSSDSRRQNTCPPPQTMNVTGNTRRLIEHTEVQNSVQVSITQQEDVGHALSAINQTKSTEPNQKEAPGLVRGSAADNEAAPCNLPVTSAGPSFVTSTVMAVPGLTSAVVSENSGASTVTTLAWATETAAMSQSPSRLPLRSMIRSENKVQTSIVASSAASPIRLKRPSRSGSNEPGPASTTEAATPELVKEPPPVHRVVSSFPSPVDSSTPSHAGQPEVTTTVVPKYMVANMKVKPGAKGEAPVRTIQMQGKDGTVKTYKINKMKRIVKPEQQSKEKANLSKDSITSRESIEMASGSSISEIVLKDPQNMSTNLLPASSAAVGTTSKDSLESGEIPSLDSEAITSKSVHKSNEAIAASETQRKHHQTETENVTDNVTLDSRERREEGDVPTKSTQKRKSEDEETTADAKRQSVSERKDRSDYQRDGKSDRMMISIKVEPGTSGCSEGATGGQGQEVTRNYSGTIAEDWMDYSDRGHREGSYGERQHGDRWRHSQDKARAPKKVEKKEPGWYTGVIDDDDLAEIEGKERTMKIDIEETFVKSLEACIQDENFRKLGQVFMDFVKHRLLNGPTYKKKLEDAFFMNVISVSGRFDSFLDGIEQALLASGETRPLCDVPVVRNQLSALALSVVTRTLRECLWSHTYKILCALEQRKTDEANKAVDQFITGTERACVVLTRHLENNMLDKAIDILEAKDIDWLSVQKMTIPDTVKIRTSRISLLTLVLRKLLNAAASPLKHKKSQRAVATGEDIQSRQETYCTKAVTVLENILQTYKDDVKVLESENYQSIFDLNLHYNRMIKAIIQLRQTRLLLHLYGLQFNFPHVHTVPEQHRKIIMYMEKHADSQELMSETIKIAHHGVLCQLYPQQEAIRLSDSHMLVWSDLTSFEMYLLLLDRLCTMCRSFAHYAGGGQHVTAKSCSLTIFFVKRPSGDPDLKRIFEVPLRMRKDCGAAKRRFTFMMQELFMPPTQVQQQGENRLFIHHEKLVEPLKFIWYNQLKNTTPPPWQEVSDNAGSLQLSHFVQRIHGGLWTCTGTTFPSSEGSSPASFTSSTPPRLATEGKQGLLTGKETSKSTVSHSVGAAVQNVSDYSTRKDTSESPYGNPTEYYGSLRSSQYSEKTTNKPSAAVSSSYDKTGQSRAYGRQTDDPPMKHVPSPVEINPANFSQLERSTPYNNLSQCEPPNAQLDGLSRQFASQRPPGTNYFHQTQLQSEPFRSEHAHSGPNPTSSTRLNMFHSGRGRSSPQIGGRRSFQGTLPKGSRESPDSAFDQQITTDRAVANVSRSMVSQSVYSGPGGKQPIFNLPLQMSATSPVQVSYPRLPQQVAKLGQSGPAFSSKAATQSQQGQEGSDRCVQTMNASSCSPAQQLPPRLPPGQERFLGRRPPSNPSPVETSLMNSIRNSVGQRLQSMLEMNQLKETQNICEIEETLSSNFFEFYVRGELERNQFMTFNDDLFDKLTDFLSQRLY